MIFEQIRNATVILHYDNKKILIDPWFAPKEALGTFNTLNMGLFSPYKEKNSIPMPMAELPLSVESILNGIDVCIVTHIHPDHIDLMPDGTIGHPLLKSIPVIARDAEDLPAFEKSGFSNTSAFQTEPMQYGNITLTRTSAVHGTKIPCGPACGVIFQSPNEPTVYLMGDTVWTEEVEETIRRYQPDVVIMNACAAELVNFGILITGKEDIKRVSDIAPNAVIIASHMDTVAHQTVSRKDIKAYLNEQNLPNTILIPEDGERLNL